MLPVTIGSILLGLAILVLLVLFLVRPFFRPQPQQEETTGRKRQLLARKAAYLETIRTLDFDHDTGKLPDEEYEQQRALLMSEAAAVIKALDELPQDPQSDDVFAQIEAAVNKIKQQRAVSSGAPANFCASCGHRLDAGDRFCASCGQPVYVVQPST